MATTLPRPTPAQKRLLLDLVARSGRDVRPVEGAAIGSHSTMWHLVRKGYATAERYYGPRGGEHYRYLPTQAAVDLAERHYRPYRDAAAKVDEYFERHHGTKNAHLNATVEGWAPLPEHLHGKGYGNDFRPLNRSDVFTPEGLRRTFGRGFTTIAVTVHSNDYDRKVTADFSIGELMRADNGEA